MRACAPAVSLDPGPRAVDAWAGTTEPPGRSALVGVRPDSIGRCLAGIFHADEGDPTMNNTSTWRFETLDQARNAKDDLRGTGIPMENVFVDEAGKVIKVIVAKAAQPEIAEILGRHGLTAVP
jgi:hypothetical protein